MRNYLAGFIPLCAAAGFLCLPSFAQDEGEVVNVNLKDGDLGFKELTVKSEEARFEVENGGTRQHAFELEGEIDGKKFEIATPVLKPGEKATIIVALPAGKYEAYCPVDDHRQRGMAGEITFAGK